MALLLLFFLMVKKKMPFWKREGLLCVFFWGSISVPVTTELILPGAEVWFCGETCTPLLSCILA